MLKYVLIAILGIFSGLIAFKVGYHKGSFNILPGFIFGIFSAYSIWNKVFSVKKLILWITACGISYVIAAYLGIIIGGVSLGMIPDKFVQSEILALAIQLIVVSLMGILGASIVLSTFNKIISKISGKQYVLTVISIGIICILSSLVSSWILDNISPIVLIMPLWQGCMLLVITQLLDENSFLNKLRL